MHIKSRVKRVGLPFGVVKSCSLAAKFGRVRAVKTAQILFGVTEIINNNTVSNRPHTST